MIFLPRRENSLRGIPKGGSPTKRNRISVILAVILFLLALGLTLYPIVSNFVNEKYASQIHTAYQEVIEQTDDSDLRKAKDLADAYNRTLIPGASDAYSQESLQSASRDYASQLNLAGNGIMGYVEIPKISVNLPIYHGTENASLERGIGHLLGSSLPVGGESTHSILSGHSGMASQKMFTDLEQLTSGDIFYLHVLKERLAYQVVEIHTVLPYDTSLLGIVPGEDLCTLITCTPYGVNTHRLLVRGTRIPYEEAAVLAEEMTEQASGSTWEQKYLQGILWGVIAALGLGVLAFSGVRISRKIRKGGGKYVSK